MSDLSGRTVSYSYTARDELASVTEPTGVTSYSYDANGEQVSRVLNGVRYTLSWDDEGQLVGITGNGSVVAFGYDALGRRVLRSANGTTTQMVYDGSKIALELQGDTVTAVYRYGNSLVARNDEVLLSDGLGTVRQTVDGVQAVTSILTTEAFGNTVSQWGTSSNPYRFAGLWGYRDDGDAGLLHVGARYYDPQVGRFISRDAVLSEHPYLYCEHEPVNAVDPSGYIWGRWVIWGVGAIVLPRVEDRFNIPPEATWPIAQLIDEIGDDLMDKVRLPGFGSAFGAVKTIIDGMDTLAEGVCVVVGYRHRVEEYMDPDGRWDGVD